MEEEYRRCNMKKLSKIQKIDDLREIWPHEAKDFTQWLSQEENLDLLGETIGLDILLIECESSVGGFNVDIFAEENTQNGRKIIIENQLEITDHDHLGKIITYAAGKSADIIVWIVKKAKDEHKQAVEWLNQHTDEDISFFLIEIEVWQIDDSLPAPKFNIIEQPNEWIKFVKSSNSQKLTDVKLLQLSYWEEFSRYAFQKVPFKNEFSVRTARPQHWYDMSLGSSKYRLSLTLNTQKKRIYAGIYISNAFEIYDCLYNQKGEIEKFLCVGGDLEISWVKAKKDSSVYISIPADISIRGDNWKNFFDWHCEAALKVKAMMKKFVINDI